MSNKGHCPHGKFDILKGCPQCIEERREQTHIDAYHESQAMAAGTDPNAWRTGEEEQRLEPGTETALVLKPGEDMEAHGWHQEAMKLLKYAEKRVIATLDDVKVATDDLSIISKLKKAMTEKRKQELEPSKLETEAIRGTYDYLMAPVFKADKITRDKVLAFNQEQERIRLAQEEINRKRTEAAEQEMKLNGELSEPVGLVEVAPEAPKRTSTELGTAGRTDHWVYEIVDPLAVPREYLVVDTAMLNAIAKKHHDQKQIPGVRFINKPIITVRGR